MPVTWVAWAPVRIGSAELPQVVLGGAPVWLPVPPWHITQFTFQLATPAGRAVSWHSAQAKPVEPPERSAPWHAWHWPSPLLAWKAWKPGLAWSVQAAGWPARVTVPSVWVVVLVWQPRQSALVGVAERAGWTAGSTEAT